jgi:opacity protein-like surface antigen
VLLACSTAIPVVARSQVSGGDGFLFGRPHGTFAIRGGFASPTAGSDVFSFAAKNLTLSKGDFGSASFGADLGLRLSDRLDLQFGVSSMGRTVNSEFRKWVDNDNKPIEQQTGFDRVPVTAGLKLYLTSPGRSISRLAWIPSKLTPYVAAGGGMMWYSFRQSGDFVDFQTLDVFSSKLSSSSWTPMAYAAGGIDYSLTSHLSLTTEARYDLARATMSNSFEGFNRIDLSGLTANVGLSVRF